MACPRIEQAGLKARGKVMASTGANTNGMLIAGCAVLRRRNASPLDR